MDYEDQHRGHAIHRVTVPLSNHCTFPIYSLSVGANVYYIGQGIRYLDYVDFRLRGGERDMLAIYHPLTDLGCQGAPRKDLEFVAGVLRQIQERSQKDERTTYREIDARAASIAVLRSEIYRQIDSAAESRVNAGGSETGSVQRHYDSDAGSDIRSNTPMSIRHEIHVSAEHLGSIEPKVMLRKGAGIQLAAGDHAGLVLSMGGFSSFERVDEPLEWMQDGRLPCGHSPHLPWTPIFLPVAVMPDPDPMGLGQPAVHIQYAPSPVDFQRTYRRPQPSAEKSGRKSGHSKHGGKRKN